MENDNVLSLAEETAYIARLLKQAQDRWTRLKRRDPETKVAWENILGTLFGGTAQELTGAAEMIRTMSWTDGLASWFDVSPLGRLFLRRVFAEKCGIASMLAVMIQYRQQEASGSWLEVAANRQALNRIIVRGCQLAILPEIPFWIEHELLDSLLDCSRILTPDGAVQVDVCRYPVTQFLYEQVTETNPSAFLGDLAPVDTVSWLDALHFCNRLSALLGLEEPYQIGDLPADADCTTESRGQLEQRCQWFSAPNGS